MKTQKPEKRSSDYYSQYKSRAPGRGNAPAERQPQDALSVRHGLGRAAKDFDWMEKSVPCQAACPAQTDIPGYLDAIVRGDFEEAYRINLRDNVFPAVLGRVCTRPCEPACRHGWKGLGEPVAICFSKRSAADFMERKDPIVLPPYFPKTGRRIAVVGSGGAGLAAARELALLGHDVEVLEKMPEPGGLMMYGIPEFRLPREMVRREVEQIRLCGVRITCGAEVGKATGLDALLEDHDAVIVASGASRSQIPDMPGNDLAGARHGLRFLFDVHTGHRPAVGKRVVVIGGGFTAVDCARTARRLGAESVGMYYRRSEQEMYITPGEVEAMREEGVTFETMASPEAVIGDKGRVAAVRFLRTRLRAPDPSGRRGIEPIAGSAFDVPADTVLFGTGQARDDAWMGRFAAGLQRAEDIGGLARTRTGVGKLFMTGDFAIGSGSLIDAIGHGKSCARDVDHFLLGFRRLSDAVQVEDAESTGRTREMDLIPRQEMPTLPDAKRSLCAEVEKGLGRDAARTEATRCYLCHYKYEIDNDLCIYCDRCLKVKPVDDCIVKVSSLIWDDEGRIVGFNRSKGSKDYNMLYIDASKCIRCGACKEVCPVECIDLQAVSRRVVKAGESA
jgi:NADPH-dependent glutamate synthase beta subunit-like oxidoreductase/ferredoxin